MRNIFQGTYLASTRIPPTQSKRHLDRSNGQPYRPLRSGEIPVFRTCRCCCFRTCCCTCTCRCKFYVVILSAAKNPCISSLPVLAFKSAPLREDPWSGIVSIRLPHPLRPPPIPPPP